jgi:hypothetical protein
MTQSKLKWNKARLLAYLGFVYLVTLIAEDQLYGTHYTTWIWGGVFILWGVAQTIRTKIVFYMLFGILCGLGAWHYELAAHWDTVFSMQTFLIHLITLVGFLFFRGFRLFSKQKRLERNARRLFELAAAEVNEKADGFTGRPFAAGKTDSSMEEVRALGRYLDALDIAKIRMNGERTIMVFSMTTSPLAGTNLERISHITFKRNGEFFVKVSESDYQQYKEQFTFDQLCNAIANIFRRYLKYYVEGKESRIAMEMNVQ